MLERFRADTKKWGVELAARRKAWWAEVRPPVEDRSDRSGGKNALARLSGVDKKTLVYLEAGEHVPQHVTFAALEQVLGMLRTPAAHLAEAASGVKEQGMRIDRGNRLGRAIAAYETYESAAEELGAAIDAAFDDGISVDRLLSTTAFVLGEPTTSGLECWLSERDRGRGD